MVWCYDVSWVLCVFSCCSIVTNIMQKVVVVSIVVLVDVYSCHCELQDFLPQLNYEAEWKDCRFLEGWSFTGTLKTTPLEL